MDEYFTSDKTACIRNLVYKVLADQRTKQTMFRKMKKMLIEKNKKQKTQTNQ